MYISLQHNQRNQIQTLKPAVKSLRVEKVMKRKQFLSVFPEPGFRWEIYKRAMRK